MGKLNIRLIIFVTLIGILTTATSKKCVLNMTSLELQANFDFDKFMGRWYEVKAWFHSSVAIDELWDDHSRLYTKQSSGVADALSSGRTKNSSACTLWTGHKLVSGGRLFPARLTLKVKTSRGTLEDRPLYVVATDYDNYALTVECINKATLYSNGTCLPDPNVYMLSRSTTLKPADASRLDDIINDKICHTGLDEFRPNFHSKQCEVSSGNTAAFSSRLWSSIVLFTLYNLLRTIN